MNYLNQYFLSREQLIQTAQISRRQLLSYQEEGLMPKPSYQLESHLHCNSYFGPYRQEQSCEYYAKGYCSWIAVIQEKRHFAAIFQNFHDRYKARVAQLHDLGFRSGNPKFSAEISTHIEIEWGHFTQGIYGLCTRSGLPEDIAAKELATTEIQALLEHKHLNPEQRQRLNLFVDLLDKSSALFAPHERVKSSRHRLVDRLRREFDLKTQSPACREHAGISSSLSVNTS
ncbi:DUF6058 family natural product biosynthesis protein [Microbulbifer sp. SSSA002]|uniref:DUF6058 family natural product biosynthesis protein n=1 Tax=Microbulbifer sp. SSSA002 TaxID=3243376 RepID=UPI0040397958